MALSIPNGHGQAVLHWRYLPLSRDVSVTLGYKDITVADDPNAAATDIAVSATGLGSIAAAAQMSTQYQFRGVSTLQRTSAGFLVAGADVTVVTGTQVAPTNAVPVFNTLVVSKRTAFAGIRQRGRMYPPMTTNGEENVDAGGTILAATVTALQVFWNTFYTNVSTGDYPPYLLHSVDPPPPLPTAITSFFIRPVVGMQRRRRTRGA